MTELKMIVLAAFTLIPMLINLNLAEVSVPHGFMSLAIKDLINFKQGFQGIDPTLCPILSFNIDPLLQQDISQILGPRQEYLIMDEVTNVTVMRKTLHKCCTCLFVIVPYGSIAFEKLQDAIELIPNRRIIFTPNQSKRLSPLGEVKSKAYMLESVSKGSGFHMHIFCPNCRIPVFKNVDFWTPDNGFRKNNLDYFELFGKTLIVSIFGAPPFIEPKINPKTKRLSLHGIDIDILTLLAKKFRFRVKPKPEKTWGYFSNHSWSGTIGSVKDGISNLGIGHVSITYDRYQVIDYSSPTYIVEYGHISNKPKILDPFKNVVMPFQNLVWIFIAAMVLVVGFTFFIIYFTYTTFSEHIPYKLGKVQSLLDFIIIPLSMLVQQDRMKWFKQMPKSSSGSIMVLVWSMGGVVLMLSYLSNLRASLIAVEYEKPIDTVKDIIDRDENLWYIEGTSLLENLRTSPIAEIQALYEQVVRKNTFFKFSGGLPAEQLKHVVNTGQGSVITHKLTDLLLREGILKLFGYYPFHFTKQIHITVYAGFVMPKNSGYRDDINFAINGMLEFGIIDYLILRKVPYYVLYGNENSKVAPVPSAIKFITIASSLIFWGSMLIISLIIFLLELHHWRERIKQRKMIKAAERKGNRKIFLQQDI